MDINWAARTTAGQQVDIQLQPVWSGVPQGPALVLGLFNVLIKHGYHSVVVNTLKGRAATQRDINQLQRGPPDPPELSKGSRTTPWHRHMENKEVIRDNHCGFTKDKLCLTNVMTFYSDITVLVEKGRATDIIYLDLNKAFDTVTHDILVSTLERCGFD
ncbi:rna-directed dna polymerase from mobile element jockey- hypothetical protein [Limosa lapponica baueri]|uniref:Rna-directed dna polymerase from mobile element jockey-like n=1 Tax=Limosa lapponica baueri TaxID=1758121 RepID=A0A2I0U640_LIMLA|nr:rna-directed dna polymerase from mobile element jockey- hypothetical protein [Limosa lapponica baueri]